jgi:hypothetical protein
MNYQAFTDDSLKLMHRAALGALAVDDELDKLGLEARFRVRETSDWILHTVELEAEMLRRGLSFTVIKWSGDKVPPLAESDGMPKPLPVEDQTVEGAARLRDRIVKMIGRRFRLVSEDVVG